MKGGSGLLRSQGRLELLRHCETVCAMQVGIEVERIVMLVGRFVVLLLRGCAILETETCSIKDTHDCCGVFLLAAAFFFLSCASKLSSAARMSAMSFGNGYMVLLRGKSCGRIREPKIEQLGSTLLFNEA